MLGSLWSAWKEVESGVICGIMIQEVEEWWSGSVVGDVAEGGCGEVGVLDGAQLEKTDFL